jgi:hypothetical protein
MDQVSPEDHVGAILDRWLARDGLPALVQTLRASPWCPAGTVLIWSAKDRAYVGPCAAFFVWADAVRSGWGTRFSAAPAVQLEFGGARGLAA